MGYLKQHIFQKADNTGLFFNIFGRISKHFWSHWSSPAEPHNYIRTDGGRRKVCLVQTRVTRCVCEKLAQNVAQPGVLSKLMHKLNR
jgi:hypothetical protein